MQILSGVIKRGLSENPAYLWLIFPAINFNLFWIVHSSHHFPIMFPSFSHHVPIMFPSICHHFPIMSLSFSHHVTIIFPSCFPIMLPSFCHHFPIIFPSSSHHVPIKFAMISHHVAISFPSFSHQFAIHVSLFHFILDCPAMLGPCPQDIVEVEQDEVGATMTG